MIKPLELSPFFVEGLRTMNTLSNEEILEYLEIDSNMRWSGWSENVIEAVTSGFTKHKPIYSLLVVWHMSQGYSLQSFGALIGVPYKTVYTWPKIYPEFGAAADIGKICRLREWEGIINASATGKSKGNAASIIFALKNYFPDNYKDKREMEHSGNVYVVDTGIRREPKQIESGVIDAQFEELDTTNQVKHIENMGTDSDGCVNISNEDYF